jgi:1-aminocyclopropane-1-carboxylate deaminase
MLPYSDTEIQLITHPLLEKTGVELAVFRLDHINQEVSGNKFFKLKYNLQAAKEKGLSQVLTFGGAYSNHIFATASAARFAGLQSIGIIRGDGIDENNPTLSFAKECGMKFHFVNREKYRMKKNPEFLEDLRQAFGNFYLIPEGGTNNLAIKGTSEILLARHHEFTHVCIPIGTGGTFAGLALSIHSGQKLLGFSSLKGDFIHSEIQNLLDEFSINPKGETELFTEYHFGGYAKWKAELLDFLHWFKNEFEIVLDPIYTGKMAFGIWDLIQKKHFPKGSKILMIHTGGLQGIQGFIQRTGIEIPNLSR